MLIQIKVDSTEKRALTEERERKDRSIQQKENEISSLGEEIDPLKLVHSSETKHIRLQLHDLNTQSQLTKAESEAELTELRSKAE